MEDRTVYILIRDHPWDGGTEILGVFSSNELAEDFKKMYCLHEKLTKLKAKEEVFIREYPMDVL